MKSFAVSVTLFVILLAVVIANSVFLCGVFDGMSEIAASLTWDLSSQSDLDKLISLWEDNRSIITYSIEEDEIDRMNELTQSLLDSFKSSDAAAFEKYRLLLIDLCDEFSRYEKLSLESLF